MTHNSSKTEEFLKRIRSHTANEQSQKKRKWSKIILLVDAFFLVIILGFIYSNKEDVTIQKTELAIEDLYITASLERQSGTEKNYYLTVSIHSTAETPKTFFFNKNIGTAGFYYQNDMIGSKTIGENNTRIDLQPQGTKSFIELLEIEQLEAYALKHPDYIKSEKVLFFYTDPPYIPVKTRITINTRQKVSLILNFKYRTSQ